MKRLGLISLFGLALVAPPGAARAANGMRWHGGVRVVPAPHVAPAPVPRPYATPRYAAPGYRGGYYHRGYAPAYPRYAPAHTRVWVPGYWGLHGGARIWIGGAWTYPPFAGWVWVAPHWAWNGYQWVWAEGTWAPPY